MSLVVRWRWTLLSALLSLLGVMSLVSRVPGWLNVLAALISLAALGPDVAARLRKSNEYSFSERASDDFADLAATIDPTRFEVFAYRTGTFLLDETFSGLVRSDLVRATLSSENYDLPPELASVGQAYMRKRIAGRLDVFNGPVLGLGSNLGDCPTDVTSVVNLIPGRYFDHLSSDLFASTDVWRDGRPVPELGRRLVIDRNDRPRDFGDSWLLNAIGSSVVAFTTDGWLVAVHQTHRNESARDQLAPSGSGSLEPQDFDGLQEMALSQLAVNGALREMKDEAGITEQEVRGTAFLGFGRWLEKGGKPELLTLAMLTIDSHEARRRRRATEDRPFSKFSEPIRLVRSPTEWNWRQPAQMLDCPSRALSLPLLASLALVARLSQVEDSPVSGLMANLFEKRHG